MPIAEATGCYVGATGAGTAVGELCEPFSGRRAARDHSDPPRRRGLLLLGLSGVCFFVCARGCALLCAMILAPPAHARVRCQRLAGTWYMVYGVCSSRPCGKA